MKYIFAVLLGIANFSLYSQNSKQIEIVNTNELSFDKSSGTTARKLIGNVQFKLEEAIMFCDSAYFYSDENKIDAFGHVSIHQGDTLHLYGETLNYNGNTKVAKVRNKVKLIDKEATLTTDYLDFEIANDIGYYMNGGYITNDENKLSSNIGYYYAKQKIFFYRGNVVIVNPRYTINSDTLKYNTVSRTAFFFGPTDIISKENNIYCENGWYNTATNISQFNKNAYLKSGKRLLKGDSLYYERNTGLGKAFRHIWLVDSVQQIILAGNFARYVEKPEFAMITDSALFIKYDKADTMYMHADTLRSVSDTANKEKSIKAYRHVKIFKNDMQGKCDSLTYNTKDSTMRMYERPVLWSEQNQLSADYIELHMMNKKISSANFYANAFIISQEDTGRYNQIKGKKMIGYFKNNELYKVFVSGNGQTVYYAKDKQTIIGVNKALSSDLTIYLTNRKIDKIVFLTKPDATLFPIHKVNAEDLILKDFKWLEALRPKNKNDIFISDK